MQRKKTINTLAVFAITATLGLAGCGGGGGGDDDPAPTFDGDTLGTVAKGIVIDGPVTAEELDTNGNVLRQVGSATTDASGGYSLDIADAYAGGVIRLTLASDGTSTQMICDVQPDCAGVAYGAAMALPASFNMTALLPAVQDGASVSAQITPFSHMAASRVASGGEYTSDAVKNAISEINQMVGVDVLYTSPVDITDPVVVDTSTTEELVYSAFTAGVGALMFDAVDLTAGLTDLADTFADGVFDSTDEVSIVSVLEAVESQAIESGIDSLVLDQILATIEAELVDTDSDGIPDEYDPEPTDTATLTAVEQAKELVSEVRTLVSSIEEPASDFEGQLDLTSTVINHNTQALLELTNNVVIGVFDYIGTNIVVGTIALDTEYTVTIYDRYFNEIGNVTVVLTDNSGLSMTITGSGLLNDVNLALTIDSNLPAASLLDMTAFDSSLAEFSFNGTVNNTETSIAFNAMDAVFTLAGDTTVDIDPINPLELTVDQELVLDVSLSGGILITDTASSASFSGTTIIEFVELQPYTDGSVSTSSISLSEISLDGEFADANNSFSADLGLMVNNAATFDTIAYLEGESRLLIDEVESGDSLDLVAQLGVIPDGYTVESISYSATRPYDIQTCIEGTYLGTPGVECLPGDFFNTHNYFEAFYPDAVDVGDFDVEYTVSTDTTAYSGVVSFLFFETAENYLEATLTATLDLVVDGYPDASAVVTVNRTDLDGGDAIITLTSDGSSITFNIEKLDGDVATGVDPVVDTITVTNPDGVVMVITAATDTDPISGGLTVDGTNVGIIEQTDLGLVLIRYEDGTFETLY
ncbi:MAG: hypothetical protein QNJ78_04945 [Gammaproteobacteria bacterium]|nr:hypothetical protein [Gammaproteobacteria bacterium]